MGAFHAAWLPVLGNCKGGIVFCMLLAVCMSFNECLLTASAKTESTEQILNDRLDVCVQTFSLGVFYFLY